MLMVDAECRAEDRDSGRVIGGWVLEVFWKEEDPFDVSAARNISEAKTRAHVDRKGNLIAFACIGPVRASPTYASHKMMGPMAITRSSVRMMDSDAAPCALIGFHSPSKLQGAYKVSV
jgi:hypothetical protein